MTLYTENAASDEETKTAYGALVDLLTTQILDSQQQVSAALNAYTEADAVQEEKSTELGRASSACSPEQGALEYAGRWATELDI